MTPSSYEFYDVQGVSPVAMTGELPRVDPKKIKKELNDRQLRDEQIRSIRNLCRRVHESTDRAVFFNNYTLSASMGINYHGGFSIFSVLCLIEPDYAHELHAAATEWALKNARALLPEINRYIDIMWVASDDWGTQQNLIASPKVYRDLFLPYRRSFNEECRKLAPEVKIFLHSCGAVYGFGKKEAECFFRLFATRRNLISGKNKLTER